MTCEKTQTQLNDYVDGTLTVLQREVISKHCEKCKTCAESIEKMRAQIAALRSLPVPPASESFYQNVVANAVESAQQGQSTRVKQASFYKFATAAMISALVVWLGFIAVPQTEDRELYLVEVDNEVRTIQVAIESGQSLDSVSMHVELSDNLELSGFGNKKTIKWSTGLREGVNVISLPIVGIAEGRGDITTRVLLNGKEKVMRIKTEYKLPGSVLYENSQVLQG